MYIHVYDCQPLLPACSAPVLPWKRQALQRDTIEYVFNVHSSTGFGQSRGQIILLVFMETGSCLLLWSKNYSYFKSRESKRVSWVFIYQLAREPGNRQANSWPRCWCRTVSCSEPGACFQPEQCFSTTIWFLLDSNWTEIISISAHLVCDANQPAGSALWPILWPPSSDSFLLVEDRNHAHHQPTSRFNACIGLKPAQRHWKRDA